MYFYVPPKGYLKPQVRLKPVYVTFLPYTFQTVQHINKTQEEINNIKIEQF